MRSVTQLNERWFYLPCDTANRRPPRFRDKAWQEVRLPHTPPPDVGFPARYWYCKAVQAERMPGERVYLRVDSPGANCRFFAGGVEVEKLRAGVTHTVELTRYHKRGHPLQLAFRFKGADAAGSICGGLPRGLSMITVPASHFAFDAKGDGGISIRTELSENGSAKVKVSASVLLPSEGQKITFAIGGPRIAVPVSAPAAEFAIPRPRLWSQSDSFLYSLRAILTHQDGTHLDTVDVPFGVRDFCLTSSGAAWNGSVAPVRGITRKTPVSGSTLLADKEMRLLRKLGADTLLLTGTPEEASFFAQCDKHAMCVIQTLPGLKGFKNRKDGLDTAKKLIFRIINHPSVIAWAISAENEDESTIRALCELVRHADSRRQILLTDCGVDLFKDWGDFPADAAAIRLIPEGSFKEIDELHSKKPKLPLGIMADGSGGDIGFARFLRELSQTRPWLNVFSAGTLYCSGDSTSILSAKNEPEDEYYLLRACWSEMKPQEEKDGNGGGDKKEVSGGRNAAAPFVHICAYDKDNPNRVVVYSNAQSVILTVNGNSAGEREGAGVFVFDGLTLEKGANQLSAAAGEATHARVLIVQEGA